MAIHAKPQLDSDKGDILVAYLRVYMPEPESQLESGLPAGVALHMYLSLGARLQAQQSRYFVKKHVWGNVFRKPWAEMVREGSPHFPDGKLEVKATLWQAMKKREELNDDDEE